MRIVGVSAGAALCGDILCGDDWCANGSHGSSARMIQLRNTDRRRPMVWLRTKKGPLFGTADSQGTAGFGTADSLGTAGVDVPENLPVHRPEVIEQLGRELPSQADALRYRDHFARLLPERIQDLTAGVRSKDHAAAVATLLSLNVGSCMVGAPRLEYVANLCLADIQNGRKSGCLPTLVREAERFLTHLAAEQRASEGA